MDEKPPAVTEDTTELTADYANNTFFESTVWDLKILFGEFSVRNNSIDWHTSVTLPWAQAKLTAYYLLMNVAFHEISQGPIHLPQPVLPPAPPELTDETRTLPNAQALHDFAVALYRKFMDGLGKPPSV